MMILYKSSMTKNKIERPIEKLNITIEERPERPNPKYNTSREKQKYIKKCEMIIRKSSEYRDYIKFLKEFYNADQCAILQGLKNKNGKRYRIELHHEPFTLFDIVQTVINKRLSEGENIRDLTIADEVTSLHYNGEIGLIPLTITMHELVHNGRIFIPLQFVYNNYNIFYKKYYNHIEDTLDEKIQAKVNLSLQTENFVSDCLTPSFTYLNIDGFEFPEVPNEWKDILSIDESKNGESK